MIANSVEYYTFGEETRQNSSEMEIIVTIVIKKKDLPVLFKMISIALQLTQKVKNAEKQ